MVERVNGPQPGFVLAGRNMREIEAREAQVGHMAGLTWLGMLGLIAVGTVAFGWYTRKHREDGLTTVFIAPRDLAHLISTNGAGGAVARTAIGQSYSHSMVPGGLEVMS